MARTVSSWGVGLCVCAMLLALLGQAIFSMRHMTATYDETTHLPAGYSYLDRGDFRLNPQHPPLIKELAAWPLTWLRPAVDYSHPAWAQSPPDEWAFGAAMLYGNEADRLLFWGRLPVVLLGALAAFYVFVWARDLFGTGAGLTALGLACFSPTLIAHTRWVTFDAPLACFSTMALYHLWRFTVGLRRWHAVAAGLALGAAMATKYSALVLVAVVPFLLVAALWRRLRGPSIVAVPLLVVLPFLVVQASYGFSPDLGLYWRGLAQVNADHNPDFAYYLMGEFRPGGWWYYFVVAFLVKTPLPTLIAAVAAVVLSRRYRASRWSDELFLVVPALAYLVATSAGADNLGVRYLLPILPLLFVFISRLAVAFVAAATGVRLAATLLVVWYIGSTLWIYPDHLAYFNEIAGGPARGHRWLDDSNISWGQDLKRIKASLDRHGIGPVRMRYGRNTFPRYYGIDARPISDAEWIDPPPGDYLFGTHLLIRGEQYARERGLATDWLSRYEPIDRVGYSAYLFRFD